MAKVVVALGGNALGKSPEEQLELVKNTAASLVGLIDAGHQVVISHGNGPQVGQINLGMNFAAENGKTAAFPFPECGAMSQGYIGYHLQQSLQNELHKRWMKKNVVTTVTQIAVDPTDPAFENPTKPVGDFYSKEQAEQIAAEKGYTFVEDAGRGYRQVVPSPLPKKIIELDSIETLINNGDLVIAGGGGGIPVVITDDGLQGVPAVIDKDRSSALLADNIDADKLIILTAVDMFTSTSTNQIKSGWKTSPSMKRRNTWQQATSLPEACCQRSKPACPLLKDTQSVKQSSRPYPDWMMLWPASLGR